MWLRPAARDDITAMQTIDSAANQRFREHDDPRIAARADDPPYSADGLERAIDEHRAWVALDDDGTVVGFSVGWTFDGEAHLDEVAVLPEHGRRGIGRALVDAVVAWAVAQQLTSMTLTTFRDVAWNAPYYERLGFHVVTNLTPALQRLLDHQASWGFVPQLRVVMRRSLSGSESQSSESSSGPRRRRRRERPTADESDQPTPVSDPAVRGRSPFSRRAWPRWRIPPAWRC